MDFGIWVEPEMVNPDSDLYRAHPDWALVDRRLRAGARHATNSCSTSPTPTRSSTCSASSTRCSRDHDIAYVKWDMNRDHVQGSGAEARPARTRRRSPLYRLLDELRSRHPTVEIESCSSGGARIDHEILRRTERVWTSDCNDALERQTIQRGASMFIPPEVMGAHIGPPRRHTTGRLHTLAFRAATAMFGHLGIEWNLLALDDDELDELAEVVALHKRFRPLLHGGDAVRFDPDDGAASPTACTPPTAPRRSCRGRWYRHRRVSLPRRYASLGFVRGAVST